jgi:cytochrome o ubiquinol oxidase subunit 2
MFAVAGWLGLAALSGCKQGVLDPKGPIATAQLQILYDSTGIMLAIVIPTIIATLGVAFGRSSRNRAGSSCSSGQSRS